MQGHRRRRATKKCTATPVRPKGYGGTGSSTALALLDNAHTLPASRRLVSEAGGARNATSPITGTGS